MKTKNIITVCLMLLTTTAFSQKDSSGIYFTSADFENNRLSYAIYCKTQKHKISADLIFRNKIVSVKHNGTVYTFQKDSVYAARYCDNSIVRFSNNQQYPLLNPDETIMIYKVVNGSGHKGSPIVTRYYFSNGAIDGIRELTLYNLKSSFSDNHKFHNLLDMQFNSDFELIEYDRFHKCYKINQILKFSLE
ncbi:MAG: hypothetical protein IPN29_04255 [Saprospiraceae bacterium]|nr:hypothetical protein [Saprospiraceae bacterium]